MCSWAWQCCLRITLSAYVVGVCWLSQPAPPSPPGARTRRRRNVLLLTKMRYEGPGHSLPSSTGVTLFHREHVGAWCVELSLVTVAERHRSLGHVVAEAVLRHSPCAIFGQQAREGHRQVLLDCGTAESHATETAPIRDWASRAQTPGLAVEARPLKQETPPLLLSRSY